MHLLNTPQRYGVVAKALHWLVVAVFLFQYIVATLMLNTRPEETTLGFSQATLYNWHKSIGLVGLLLATIRLTWRKLTPLPEWAACLSAGERRYCHWVETMLYTGMIVMPISGYLYVMAGGFGVHLFSAVHLANPIGKNELMAVAAKWTHIVAAYAVVVSIVGHVGLVLKHQVIRKNPLLQRMLPFGRP
ncbi:MAG: cytochrome b [Defluviicoccus sp.]